MNAVIYSRYGGPNVLACADVPIPVPGKEEVLVKMRAASINPYDAHLMRGLPFLLRVLTGVSKPKFGRLGVDAAGVVDAVGHDVAQFAPGDEVFGMGAGTFAEYACIPASMCAIMPKGTTFDEAASLPLAGLTALQALRSGGALVSGRNVLIVGASGGVGTLAVQIAKASGACVTGVCSSRNAEMVRDIGAEHIIDYDRRDWTKESAAYDVVLDCVGEQSLRSFSRVLSPTGTYVLVGGVGGPLLGPIPRLIRLRLVHGADGQRFVGLQAKRNCPDLTTLQALAESREVVPHIETRYALSECRAALRHIESGRSRGKVVFVM